MSRKQLHIVLYLFIGITSLGYSQTRDDVFASERVDPATYVQLFPNPATDYVTVKLESPHARTTQLSLHSLIGNSIEAESEIVDDYQIRIKVRDLPSGYYFLAIRDSEANFKSSFKFLKR